MGSIAIEDWISLQLLSHFKWHWASQCTDTRCYIAALTYLFSWISSVAISRWQGFDSLHEHPTSNVLEHLVSSQGPGALTQPHVCAGLAPGRDYSFCRASEQKSQKVLGPWFSSNCRKCLKTRANSVGFSTLTPRLNDMNMPTVQWFPHDWHYYICF